MYRDRHPRLLTELRSQKTLIIGPNGAGVNRPVPSMISDQAGQRQFITGVVKPTVSLISFDSRDSSKTV